MSCKEENCHCSTNLHAQAHTGLSLNVISFLNESLERMEKSFDYAYPGSFLDDSKTHAALQRMNSEVQILKTLVKNLK